MHQVVSYEQTQDFVREIRLLKKGFVTNFYWDDNKHPYWLTEGSLEYESYDDCILMVHRQEQFANIFYIATSLTAVAEALRSLPIASPQVADVVCRGDGSQERETFAQAGFEVYKHLYRMTHIGRMAAVDWMEDPRVMHGEKDDALLVFEALQKDFDPLAEQLPSLQEIEDYAERRQLLVIKDQKRLCGFLIFELSGVTWYLRYWYTSPDFRNQGVGAGLLRTALLAGAESKRQILWVIADNENAIKRYEHYGFSRENMNDFVLIRKPRV